MRPSASPRSIDELVARARLLDGARIGDLAAQLGVFLPADRTRAKGRIGEIVEQALGASSGNLDQPDFPELGVELKTIPVDRMGRVRESTFVCTLDLRQVEREEWGTSRVRRKLACVLWVPVQARDGRTLADRRLGTPRLWRPTRAQEATLRADWSELVGRIAVGRIDEITAHLGQALQVRPKARNARHCTLARGAEGEPLRVVPRGFYLRAAFTEEILWSDRVGIPDSRRPASS